MCFIRTNFHHIGKTPQNKLIFTNGKIAKTVSFSSYRNLKSTLKLKCNWFLIFYNSKTKCFGEFFHLWKSIYFEALHLYWNLRLHNSHRKSTRVLVLYAQFKYIQEYKKALCSSRVLSACSLISTIGKTPQNKSIFTNGKIPQNTSFSSYRISKMNKI